MNDSLPEAPGWDLSTSLTLRIAPLKIYFRDDDAGWEDAALMRLLDTFARCHTPIDLAVIPEALDEALAAALTKAIDRQPLGLHQHGYRHLNHEANGRKCEFGPSRTAGLQAADIQAGADRLRGLLGESVQPIFTPPWNRCSASTVEALLAAGFRALSRDAGAAALPLGELRTLPVHLDWQKRATAGAAFQRAVREEGAVGIMLHHAVMDEHDHLALQAWLEHLRGHSMVERVGMASLLN